MAKLYFNYGAMSAGKTIEVITTAYKYNSRGMKALVIKPSIDTKGGDLVTSRIGMSQKVDILLKSEESLFEYLKNYNDTTCLIVDEAQFLTEKQVLELVIITKDWNIPVICYGLRVDFKGHLFPGSKALFETADSLEELKAVCSCGNKATRNIRYVNGVPTFDGGQVAIDGENNITYESVCRKCERKLRDSINKN